jgi:hypothetical protein
VSDEKLSDIRANAPAAALDGTEILELTQAGGTVGGIISQINTFVEGQAASANTANRIVRRDANGDSAERDKSLRQLILRGDTSGQATVKAPAVAGTPTFTLPSSVGAVGEALTTDGTGVLSWASVATRRAIFGSTPNVSTGVSVSTTFASITWLAEFRNDGSLVSVSSGQYTPVAGTYRITIALSGFCTSSGSFTSLLRVRLRNITDGVSLAGFVGGYGATTSPSFGQHVLPCNGQAQCIWTTDGTKELELQLANNGFSMTFNDFIGDVDAAGGSDWPQQGILTFEKIG